jgi:transposase-like protein
VPKLRQRIFETAIIERYAGAVEEALIDTSLGGGSVRRVEDITETLWGASIPTSIWTASCSRGLNGVRMIISDACLGLAESGVEVFPDAAWQRGVLDWYRNIFSHVPSTKVREIAAMLKAIHASEDIVAAREKTIQVIEKCARCGFTA